MLHIVKPREQFLNMEKREERYFQLELENTSPETTYFYQIDNATDLPDLASHYQPQGVHGPSQVADHTTYQWQGVKEGDMILYKLHIDTFAK